MQNVGRISINGTECKVLFRNGSTGRWVRIVPGSPPAFNVLKDESDYLALAENADLCQRLLDGETIAL